MYELYKKQSTCIERIVNFACRMFWVMIKKKKKHLVNHPVKTPHNQRKTPHNQRKKIQQIQLSLVSTEIFVCQFRTIRRDREGDNHKVLC